MDLPANNAEWQSVLRLSSAHLVTPLLRWALQEHGLVSGLPTDVLEFLDAFYALNLDSNRHYEDQLAHLTQTLNRIGVRPVLLKGVAALVSGLYPTLGERMIGDIDVLVPAPRLPEILERLADEGYQPMGTGGGLPKAKDFAGFSGHHYPRIDSPDWLAGVELHVHPVPLDVARLLASEEIVRDATPLNWRGGECLIPSPTHFVTHNVIHAFAVDYYYKYDPLSLRQLFEFVYASRTYGGQIDWLAVQQRFDGRGYRNTLRGYVAFADAYLGFQVPPEFTVEVWDRLRLRLYRTRADLALPAVEWPLAIGKAIRQRARTLRKDPRRLKQLLDAGFYARLWKSTLSWRR